MGVTELVFELKPLKGKTRAVFKRNILLLCYTVTMCQVYVEKITITRSAILNAFLVSSFMYQLIKSNSLDPSKV